MRLLDLLPFFYSSILFIYLFIFTSSFVCYYSITLILPIVAANVIILALRWIYRVMGILLGDVLTFSHTDTDEYRV